MYTLQCTRTYRALFVFLCRSGFCYRTLNTLGRLVVWTVNTYSVQQCCYSGENKFPRPYLFKSFLCELNIDWRNFTKSFENLWYWGCILMDIKKDIVQWEELEFGSKVKRRVLLYLFYDIGVLVHLRYFYMLVSGLLLYSTAVNARISRSLDYFLYLCNVARLIILIKCFPLPCVGNSRSGVSE